MVHKYVDLQPKPWNLDLFAKKPYLNSIGQVWISVHKLNFKSLYLPNYEYFALGQHIKGLELQKEYNFA
jgi:hypothetical protein